MSTLTKIAVFIYEVLLQETRNMMQKVKKHDAEKLVPPLLPSELL